VSRHVLCRLEAIADPGARGFVVGDAGARRDLFVVRRGGLVFAYVNACPHIGTPLEFLPDRFLTRDGCEILCSTHGARFVIETGRCVVGPCQGKSLDPLPVRIEAGEIVVEA
jgi:nitrite reductase/ring-hydroxylating ferredoxin subunit